MLLLLIHSIDGNQFIEVKKARTYLFEVGGEGPFLADSRSLASSSERRLLRELPLNLDESAAISDPLETPIKKPPQMR
ncbi:MAG: hypothetical protein WBO58_18870, partial [Gammaproteobacteria bacterium]